MNCIFIHIDDINMFFHQLESIYIYDNSQDIIVAASAPHIDIIKKSHLFSERISFDTLSSAKSKYDKILYLHTDVIVKDNLNKVFESKLDGTSGTLIVPDCYDLKMPVIEKFSSDVDMLKCIKDLKEKTICDNISKAKEYIDENLLPIIVNSGVKHEGCIFMLHHTTNYSDVYLNKAKNISNLLLNKNIKNVMEIGFNSGFSALLMLISNPYIKLKCYDIGEHPYTRPCFQKIKETFGDRIDIVYGDSTKTLQHDNNLYDLIHIDGGHSTQVAESDIKNAYRLSAPGTILIMDDYDFPNLHTLWDIYVKKYNLQKVHVYTYDSSHHDIKFVTM